MVRTGDLFFPFDEIFELNAAAPVVEEANIGESSGSIVVLFGALEFVWISILRSRNVQENMTFTFTFTIYILGIYERDFLSIRFIAFLSFTYSELQNCCN